MSTSLTIPSLLARVQWTFSDSRAWSDSSNSASFTWSKTLANGTGDAQADKIYIAQTTLAAGATLNVDLAGALTDIYGNTISFARIKTLYFELTTDTAASAVSLGGHGSAAWTSWVGDATDKIKVLNGGVLLLGCTGPTAYAVTATTADMLTLINLDGSNVATYKLVLIGASA